MTGWRSAGSTLVKILLGTILVGVVGDLIAGYYADVREASKLKQDLGNQVMTLTAEEADDISVLAQDLAPQSWLVGRCFDDPPRLPKVAEPSGDACHSAVFDSILQEQELQLAVRATHLNGERLTADHGYPLRLIVPNRAGLFDTKWIARVEVLS